MARNNGKSKASDGRFQRSVLVHATGNVSSGAPRHLVPQETTEEVFKCEHCSQTFPLKRLLSRHVSVKHRRQNPGWFQPQPSPSRQPPARLASTAKKRPPSAKHLRKNPGLSKPQPSTSRHTPARQPSPPPLPLQATSEIWLICTECTYKFKKGSCLTDDCPGHGPDFIQPYSPQQSLPKRQASAISKPQSSPPRQPSPLPQQVTSEIWLICTECTYKFKKGSCLKDDCPGHGPDFIQPYSPQ